MRGGFVTDFFAMERFFSDLLGFPDGRGLPRRRQPRQNPRRRLIRVRQRLLPGGHVLQRHFTLGNLSGFEIITSWFPGFLLRNNVSLSLLARNTCEDGISATEVRELILNGRLPENGVVPESVYKRRETIKAFLNVFKK